jgi:hypothetical protein
MTDPGPTEIYHPSPGDIGITRISGAGGAAVRLGQWLAGDGFRDFEHAFVVTEASPALVGEMIVEAMPNGARHVRNGHKPGETVYLRCPEPYKEAVAAVALRLVGRPYSWADYGALALHHFHVPTPRLNRFIESSGHMICSQLADYAAEKGGWHLFDDGRWHGDVTPGDLTRLYDEAVR